MSCSFVVDAMLGHLAKWLRILGYDTFFDPALDDHQLVRQARMEHRILLTRDRQLARRRGVRTLLIASQELEDQIRQVMHDLDLAPDQSLSRCLICNVLLETIDAAAARERVPAYVGQTQDSFKQCPVCRRIYWRGTHWQQMDKVLARLQPRAGAVDPVPADGADCKLT